MLIGISRVTGLLKDFLVHIGIRGILVHVGIMGVDPSDLLVLLLEGNYIGGSGVTTQA